MASALDAAVRKIFGHESFRPGQREIVRSIMSGRDVFVLVPTGGGKSLCYQLPSVLSPGVTVIVCPLLALMQDQIQALTRGPADGKAHADPRLRGVPATFLSSNAKAGHSAAVFADLARRPQPLTKCLYVTPEQLGHSVRLRDCLQALASQNPSLLARVVVDEAHCGGSTALNPLRPLHLAFLCHNRWIHRSRSLVALVSPILCRNCSVGSCLGS